MKLLQIFGTGKKSPDWFISCQRPISVVVIQIEDVPREKSAHTFDFITSLNSGRCGIIPYTWELFPNRIIYLPDQVKNALLMVSVVCQQKIETIYLCFCSHCSHFLDSFAVVKLIGDKNVRSHSVIRLLCSQGKSCCLQRRWSNLNINLFLYWLDLWWIKDAEDSAGFDSVFCIMKNKLQWEKLLYRIFE